MPSTLAYIVTPVARELIEALDRGDELIACYGGMRSGKTWAITMACLVLCQTRRELNTHTGETKPIEILITRSTFGQIKASFMPSFRAIIEPLGATYIQEPGNTRWVIPQEDELMALKAEIEKMKAERLAAERGQAVRELLTSGRITPAEKAAAEAVVAQGGVELLSTVYASRKPGSAIPQLRGHSQPVEPPEGEDGSKADKAIRAFLAAEEGKGHTYLSAAALIESKQPDLFI